MLDFRLRNPRANFIPDFYPICDPAALFYFLIRKPGEAGIRTVVFLMEITYHTAMKILYYYPATFPVRMYGGSQRVIQWLIPEMIRRGHQIYLIALEGSRLEGAEIIPMTEKDSPEKIIARAPSDTDLVHLFSYKTLYDFKKPLMITFDRIGAGINFHPNTVFISKRHAQLHHSDCFIHHGLQAAEYPYSDKKEDYLMFMSTINSLGKNLDGAIRVAKDAGIRLVIAGGYRFSLSRGIESVGVIGHRRKTELLKNARGFIFPVLWDEPFGLVNIEALACGTPVIATPYGANPEIVDKDTGFICQSHREMVEAVHQLQRISPAVCRQKVENYFNSARMAEQYLELYQRLLETGRINAGPAPYLAPDADPLNTFYYYQGYRKPPAICLKLRPRINSLYTRWRERRRRLEQDEIPSRDLTDFVPPKN